MSPLLVAAAAWLGVSLESGRFPVGFEMLLERDVRRPALHEGRGGGAGRPMPVAVWYPAAKSSAPRLRLRDYLVASEQALEGLLPADEGQVVERFIGERSAAGASREALERSVATPLEAGRGAPRARGRFPLVLFAHAAPHSQSVMCEYLASHGFVVAAVRSRGATEVDYRRVARTWMRWWPTSRSCRTVCGASRTCAPSPQR